MFVILSISDSDKHRNAVVQEYTKRLGKSVKIIDIVPSRKWTPQQMIQVDTETIIAKLSKFWDYQKMLLSKEGKALDTWTLHKLFIHQNVVFIIGWPYGLQETALASFVDGKISFGTITLPHGLAKVTLLEQLYRISTIEQGKSYHY